MEMGSVEVFGWDASLSGEGGFVVKGSFMSNGRSKLDVLDDDLVDFFEGVFMVFADDGSAGMSGLEADCGVRSSSGMMTPPSSDSSAPSALFLLGLLICNFFGFFISFLFSELSLGIFCTSSPVPLPPSLSFA